MTESSDHSGVDDVFVALADPTRRRLLELLGQRPGCSASTLAGQLPVSRQAIVKHLAVLENSRLVVGRRSGREVLFSVEPDRLTSAASWLEARAGAWQQRLELLKRAAEREP